MMSESVAAASEAGFVLMSAFDLSAAPPTMYLSVVTWDSYLLCPLRHDALLYLVYNSLAGSSRCSERLLSSTACFARRERVDQQGMS